VVCFFRDFFLSAFSPMCSFSSPILFFSCTLFLRGEERGGREDRNDENKEGQREKGGGGPRACERE
jgi:hypothetical protein